MLQAFSNEKTDEALMMKVNSCAIEVRRMQRMGMTEFDIWEDIRENELHERLRNKEKRSIK